MIDVDARSLAYREHDVNARGVRVERGRRIDRRVLITEVGVVQLKPVAIGSHLRCVEWISGLELHARSQRRLGHRLVALNPYRRDCCADAFIDLEPDEQLLQSAGEGDRLDGGLNFRVAKAAAAIHALDRRYVGVELRLREWLPVPKAQ